MKITLLSEEAIRLEGTAGPLTIEAASAEQSYSPFHMLASSLASCTWSVLASWAEHKGLDVGQLAVDVDWTFAEQPKRVGSIRVGLKWPGLSADLHERALRVAALCTVHKTLEHPPAISIEHTA